MPQIHIDRKTYEVKADKNLLDAALTLGFDLPYFCWHPALGSVGACRQCAVKQFKDENDTQGKIVMACMTPADDGTRISIKDEEAVQFRAHVIEWLMVNHPHDCPICDEGGECHLQDMTVMTGHNYRRFNHRKRTFRNQYLGPFINHEMNRCITCYRCVRFYRDYAGGDDLDAFAAHNHVYFGRHEDGILQNEFSGNLVEVCPTGVFTDKTLKQHYTRKWDLQSAPSICQHCGLGCNTIPGERYGTLRRILNRYNHDVNGYFLCDRGRFGYEFVNSEKRIRQPILHKNKDGPAENVSKEEALQYLRSLLKESHNIIGIGSPRASLECNHALRHLVGADRFCSGVASREFQLTAKILDILQKSPAPAASLHDVKRADAVLILGEDVTNTAPMLALALRQSVRQQPMKIAKDLNIPEWHDAAVREAVQKTKGPLYLAAATKTKLDDIATQTYYAAPDDIARLGYAVAHELNSGVAGVDDLPDALRNLAQQIAAELKRADRPLIVSGASLGSAAVIESAANAAWALCSEERAAKICFTMPECNTLGLAFFDNKGFDDALQMAEDDKVDTVVVIENDLYRRAPKHQVDKFFDSVTHLVVIDHIKSATTARAELVLPASTFAEGSGTLINNEGRAQRFFKVFVVEESVRESWRWIRDSFPEESQNGKWQNLDNIIHAMISEVTEFKGIANVAPLADFRIAEQKIAREEHRYSGRTAMNANQTIFEPKPPEDPDSALAHSMEGYRSPEVPSSLIPYFWAPAWNSAQATNKYQSEVGGALKGGNAGVRLLEPDKNGKPAFFSDIPKKFEPRNGEVLIVPFHHIFGGEELSVLSPGLAQRIPEPYLALNPEDATALNLKEDDKIDIVVTETKLALPIRLAPNLPRGLAGYPMGLPGLDWVELPAWSKISGGNRNA